MAKSQKQTEENQTSEGVPVRTFDSRPPRYEDGVPVRVNDEPEQTAGSDNGQSAGKKEN